MSRTDRRVVLVVSLLFVGLVGSPLHSAVPAAGRYLVTSESSAQVGCLDLCRCPIRDEPWFEGSFDLVPEGSDAMSYRVENVDWRVGRERPVALRGAGTLRLEAAGDEVEQTIELQLSVDGAAPTAFRATDRQIAGLSEVIVAVALRPAAPVCRGQVLSLHAERVGASR